MAKLYNFSVQLIFMEQHMLNTKLSGSVTCHIDKRHFESTRLSGNEARFMGKYMINNILSSKVAI